MQRLTTGLQLHSNTKTVTLWTKKQIRGHHIANLDPLEIANKHLGGKNPREVIHNSYRFGKEEYETWIRT